MEMWGRTITEENSVPVIKFIHLAVYDPFKQLRSVILFLFGCVSGPMNPSNLA
jgi:hypothetical protein